MTRIRSVLNLLAAFVVCLLLNSMAHAQATQTWVSGVGNDANPCSRTAPCKTFAAALSKTLAGGEVSVLDPGGFGAVTITKAITISGDGTLADILADQVNGVVVSAGINDVVILRGLSINGVGTGVSGIKYTSGKHLHIENCTIYGFNVNASSAGIDGANPAAGEMSIVNTTITNCHIAIRVANVAGNTATISGVNISRGDIGVDVLGGNATISDSTVSHQGNVALVSENSGVINVSNCRVSNNSIGVQAFTSGSTVRVANSDIFNNTIGVSIAASAVSQTFGNNRIFGNGIDVMGTLTPTNNQ